MLRSHGEPLPASTRQSAERQIGHDFSGVRIHRDDAAAIAAEQLSARAWTYGSDIFFGRDAFTPGRPADDRLLTHELTHVKEQERSGVPSVQRDDKGSKAAPVGANEVIPYPVGARVLVSNLIDERVLRFGARFMEPMYQGLIAVILDPDVGKNIVAKISESTAERVSLTIDTPAIPAKSDRVAVQAMHVDLAISRLPDGTFQADIQLSGPVSLQEAVSFSAHREGDGRVVLSVDEDSPRVRIGTPDAVGQRVLTAENLPLAARAAVGDPAKVLAMKQLDAEAGSVEEGKEIAAASSAARALVAEKPHQASLGFGLQSGYQSDPVFTTGWRFTFAPLGRALRFPVAIQLDYVPSKSLLVGASGGVQLQAGTKVPVQLRLLGGLKGGVLGLGGPDVSRADRELKPAFGPTFGLEGAVNLGTITVGLDAEYLFNLVKDGPNVTKVGLSAAIAF